MPASTDQGTVDSIEEGQILPRHQQSQQQQQQQQQTRNLPLNEQRAQSNPMNPSSHNRNIPQSGNTTSSDLHNQGQLAPTSNLQPSELKNQLNDSTGVAGAQNVSTPTAPETTRPTTSHPSRGTGTGDFRPATQGYERKIGRGTSWRRDHKGLGEDDYTLRGRGRGNNPSPRGGRGNYYRDQETRGYQRREGDHPSSLDPRGSYPEPYYETRGPYPYDTRRDFPIESRLVVDYERYESRDIPHHLPPSPPLDRRLYERGPPGREDPEYGRPFSRSRDVRDDLRDDPRLPRDMDARYPSESRPRDLRPDPRFIDEDRLPRPIDDPRMLPPPVERRHRDPFEYRDDNIDSRRHSSVDRSYGRVASRNNDLPARHSSPPISKIEDGSIASPLTVKRAEGSPPGRESLGNGARPRPPVDNKIDPSPYDYGRERPGHPDMYREGEYGRGRGSYSNFEGRGRGIDPPDMRTESFYKQRDPRDPYYASSYSAEPPSEYRGRDAYPPREPPPSDYRGAPYDERFPRDLELDPRRGREEYRDLPPRSHEYGQKRKYDDPEYRDPYMDDYRGPDPRFPGRPEDYPPPPYDYEDRDPKRARGPVDPRMPPPFDRPLYDERELPPRDERPFTAPAGFRQGRPPPIRATPKGRYFLAKTSTAENLAKSRETGRWGIPVKDVEIFREARKAGPVTLLFSLDESGRFSGYAQMTSDVGSVSPLAWMEEHCNPVGAAFEVKHFTTDDVRTTTTAKMRNYLTEGKPIRFGKDGQEISGKEAAGLIDELERMSGPENADKRANAVVARGRGRGRGGRGSFRSRGYFHDAPRGRASPRGRGRGRGD